MGSIGTFETGGFRSQLYDRVGFLEKKREWAPSRQTVPARSRSYEFRGLCHWLTSGKEDLTFPFCF